MSLPPIVHVTLNGRLVSSVSLHMTGPPSPSAIQSFAEDLEELLQWSFENDEVPRKTIGVPELDSLCKVQPFKRALLDGDDDSDSCVICCSAFKPRRRVRRLPCGHMFCNKCIIKWVSKESATCPVCRCDISG